MYLSVNSLLLWSTWDVETSLSLVDSVPLADRMFALLYGVCVGGGIILHPIYCKQLQ